jgi:hypothetical protein
VPDFCHILSHVPSLDSNLGDKMKLRQAFGLFIVTASLIAGCVAQDISGCISQACNTCPAIELNDRDATQKLTYYNVRDYRYCEMVVTCPGVPSGIYNTIGMNNLAGYSNDSCPPPLFANYSDADVKKQYGASNSFMNGPRYWTMDKQTLNWSMNVRNLDGLDSRWGADIAAEAGGLNYVPTNVTCTRTWFFAKGKPIFILDDPSGTPWIMQSYGLLVDKSLTYKDLPTLGRKLKLPAGWKYRTKALDQDLAINGINGTEWRVTQDDLQNTYSACWKSGDQTACNFQP